MILSDADFRAAYFSKQKTSYTRNVATAILNGDLNLKSLASFPDDEVRNQLIKIKGIGNWTADVFLMMVLSRTNLFPFGDIALVNSLKYEKQLPIDTPKELLEEIVATWEPYKTIAAFILWWAYIQRKGIKL
jgi:DNA-3-methyladenine glycosylase II